MIKTISRIDETRQKAIEALQDAYGRSQKTPDGLMCRMGRIDRAYQLKASATGNAEKYKTAIAKMEQEATAAFDQADRVMATYTRLCKIEGVSNALDVSQCDCAYCLGEFTGRMNHEDWERFITAFSTSIVTN